MRSLSQIKSEMIDDIIGLRSDIKIVEGDTQHDVVIASPANAYVNMVNIVIPHTNPTNLPGQNNPSNPVTVSRVASINI